jgi:hypothetical protein
MLVKQRKKESSTKYCLCSVIQHCADVKHVEKGELCWLILSLDSSSSSIITWFYNVAVVMACEGKTVCIACDYDVTVGWTLLCEAQRTAGPVYGNGPTNCRKCLRQQQ